MPESGVERHPQERASLRSATSCSGGDEPAGGQGPGPPADREFRHSTTSSAFGRDYRKRRDMSPVFGRTTQKAEAGNRRTRIPTRLARAGFANGHASQCLDSLEVRGVTSMSATLSSRSGRAGGLVCKTPSWMPDDVQEVDRAVRFPRFRPAFLAEVADAVPPQSGSQSGSRIRLAGNCRRWSRVSRGLPTHRPAPGGTVGPHRRTRRVRRRRPPRPPRPASAPICWRRPIPPAVCSAR